MSLGAVIKFKSVFNINSQIQKIKQFIRLSHSYFRRHNPITELQNQFISTLKGALTVNKKLKIAKYRVNHLSYRLYQMEQLIDTNNQGKHRSGKSINLIR